MKRILITQTPSLKTVLEEDYNLKFDRILTGPDTGLITNQHVFGDIPIETASYCSYLTLVKLSLPSNLAIDHLTDDQIREHLQPLKTFVIHQIDPV